MNTSSFSQTCSSVYVTLENDTINLPKTEIWESLLASLLPQPSSSTSPVGAILYAFDSMLYSPFSPLSLLSKSLSCQDMFKCLLTGPNWWLSHTQFSLLVVYSPTVPTVIFFFSRMHTGQSPSLFKVLEWGISLVA